MVEQINYRDLLNQFMLQRKPYISVADVLDCLYKNFLTSTGLSTYEVNPFDFTLLKSQPNGTETFRWILGHDQTKFKHILENKGLFSKHAKLVYSNISTKPRLATYYKSVLESPEDFDDIEFLTAVFHLTYRFIIPHGVFNVGLVHKEHKKRGAAFYRARLCVDDAFDFADNPKLQIENNPPLSQITEEFVKKEYRVFGPFLQEWISTIQGIVFREQEYNFHFHLYFPVYDGMSHTQSALRGYLGIFFLDEKSREVGIEFFKMQDTNYFRNINEAYIKGTHNNIVDSYKENDRILDPVEYWHENLHRLHHWGRIGILDQEDASEIFWLENSRCKISIRRLLERKTVESYVEPSLYDTYKNNVLALEIPSVIMRNSRLSVNSAYLRKRIRELTQLLDELLRERYILMNEERIKNAARKSAVAAVMSRNMSHNLGSHVFARLCTAEDFIAGTRHNTFKKISALNAFLRTRMDFLADLSTSVPTVASSLCVYRDTMGYFRPVYADQEEFAWQELLLNHISGIDDLNAHNIEIHFLYNGKRFSLENAECDPVFASPNGLLGTHAIYIILENIIRNSAKHAYDAEKHDQLEIVFEINESQKDENLLEVFAYDQLGNANSKVEDKSELRLIDYLNRRIEESILDDEGNLRDVAWGVLEMKICAAYLRKKPLEKLDVHYDPPLLEAISVNGNLGYKFYLTRPGEILIVDTQNRFSSKEKLNLELKSHGFKILNRKEFENEIKSNVEHNFLILVDPENSLLDFVKNNYRALPTRIFSTVHSLDALPFIDFQELEQALQNPASRSDCLSEKIWPRWLSYLKQNTSLFIRPDETNIVSKWQVDGISEASNVPESVFDLDEKMKYIVYDRHGMIYKNHENNLKEMIAKKQILYYEQVQHRQPTHFIINNVANNGHINKAIIHELIEAGLIKVVLLDERIQKKVEESEEAGRKLKDIMKTMNILIPSKKAIDLDNPRNYCPQLHKWLDLALEDVTFLVVHLGIMEKLYKDNVNAMGKKFAELESYFPDLNIVIISGRGLPSTVRKLQTRFIQYSQVARYTLEERSKYHLCKVLFAARRSLA